MDHQQEWRRQKRTETHERIYQVAMRLFDEHGFERVPVGQIAAAAGVSVPTFYAHFGSKEQVVLPVPSGEAIAAVLARQPEELPLAQRLRRGVRAWFAEFGPEERAELLARWGVVAATPTLRTRAAEYERATARLVIDALPPEREDGRLTADEVVVTAYLSAVTAVFLAWAGGKGARSLEELAEEAFEALSGS